MQESGWLCRCSHIGYCLRKSYMGPFAPYEWEDSHMTILCCEIHHAVVPSITVCTESRLQGSCLFSFWHSLAFPER